MAGRVRLVVCIGIIKQLSRNVRKRIVGHVRPAMIRITLCLRFVRSASSLSTHWITKYAKYLHEDSDQTARIRRLIRDFVERTCKKVRFFSYCGFLIGRIFDLQVAPITPTRFRVNWLFGSEEEARNRFSRWRPSWTSNRNDFRRFLTTRTPILSIRFQVNWPFGSGEEAQNRFPRRRQWRPSWISDRDDLSYF